MRINASGQSQVLNIYSNNQNSAKINMNTVSSVFKNRDVLTISKQGKTESLVQQLLNQKKLIQENKEALLEKGLENGYIEQEKLDDFDEQLKAIDEQIAKVYSEETQDKTDEKTSKKYKTMTEDEYRQQKLNSIFSISGSLKNSEIALSVKSKMEGEKNVLESEIKKDGSNASESKFKRIAEIDAKTSSIMNKTGETLSEINNSLKHDNEYIIIEDPENEQSSKIPEKDNNNQEILFDKDDDAYIK